MLARSLLTNRSRGTNLVRLEVPEKTRPNMSRKCSISVVVSTVRQVYVFLSNVTLSAGITLCQRHYVAAGNNVCCQVQKYSSQRHNSTPRSIGESTSLKSVELQRPVGPGVTELRAKRPRNRGFVSRQRQGTGQVLGLAQPLTFPGLKGKTDDTPF